MTGEKNQREKILIVDDEEGFEIMKTHTTIGLIILYGSSSV